MQKLMGLLIIDISNRRLHCSNSRINYEEVLLVISNTLQKKVIKASLGVRRSECE